MRSRLPIIFAIMLICLLSIALLLCWRQTNAWMVRFEQDKKEWFGKFEAERKAYTDQFLPASQRFQLLDPQMAPKAIKDSVVRGSRLMLQTQKELPDNVGNNLDCSNCHFSGGNTYGGKNGGISLVGVTNEYPAVNEDGSKYTLADRINGCFMRSMNGVPLNENSAEMLAFLSYMEWISRDVAPSAQVPWIGLKKLRLEHQPDKTRGEQIYQEKCSMCHGKNGEGQKREHDLSYPAVWGERSYNDAAGMNNIHKFASFIYNNMPYQNPVLTVEEAYDVAQYVHEQPRPLFKQQ